MEQLGSVPLHRTYVAGLTFSPDGALVASSSLGGAIAVTPADELAGGSGASVKQSRRGMPAGVLSLAFHPKRPVLVTVGGMRHAVLWDAGSPGPPRQLSHLGRLGRGLWGPWGSTFAPGGNLLAIGAAGKAITLVDVSDLRQPRLPEGAEPNPRPNLKAPRARVLAFHPSGRWLAAGCGDGSLVIWDTARTASARQVAEFPAHAGPVHDVSFSSDGALLATAGVDDDKTVIWDATSSSSPRVLAVIDAANAPVAAFSPVAPVLAVGDGFPGNGTISLWDVTSPSFPGQVSTVATGRPSMLSWSPDGQTLAAGYFGGAVSLWRI